MEDLSDRYIVWLAFLMFPEMYTVSGNRIVLMNDLKVVVE